jgi:hypothetical protein
MKPHPSKCPKPASRRPLLPIAASYIYVHGGSLLVKAEEVSIASGWQAHPKMWGPKGVVLYGGVGALDDTSLKTVVLRYRDFLASWRSWRGNR